jgi:hypothetical protein
MASGDVAQDGAGRLISVIAFNKTFDPFPASASLHYAELFAKENEC